MGGPVCSIRREKARRLLRIVPASVGELGGAGIAVPGGRLHVLELGAVFERGGDEGGAHRVRRVAAVEAERAGIFVNHARAPAGAFPCACRCARVEEASPIFGRPYLQGLVFLSKPDIHPSCENQARDAFIETLRIACRHFADRDRNGDNFVSSLHRVFEHIIPERDHRNQLLGILAPPHRTAQGPLAGIDFTVAARGGIARCPPIPIDRASTVLRFVLEGLHHDSVPRGYCPAFFRLIIGGRSALSSAESAANPTKRMPEALG